MARDSGTVVLGVGAYPGTATLEEDADKHKARKEAGVKAQLFESYPDPVLGPLPRPPRPPPVPHPAAGGGRPPAPSSSRSSTAPASTSTRSTSTSPPTAPPSSPAGTPAAALADLATHLVAVDTATGDGGRWPAATSPTGASVARPTAGRWSASGRSSATPTTPSRSRCGWSTSPPARGATSPPTSTAGLARPVWAPDSSAVYFVADEDGRAPAFRVDVASGEVTRLSAAGAFSDLCPSPDGTTLYALRNTMASPPQAVALDTTAADQEPRPIPTPGFPVEVPGRVEELTATAADGTPVHSWLALPADASDANPAPLVAVDPRRAARVVEQLALAVEPLAARRAGLRRAHARPGAVDRLRPGLRRTGAGPVGRRALHRPHGRHRRCRRPARHRRDQHRGHGRLVRRLHGQLGGRPHRPVPLPRHPRQPVGPRPVPRHHRPRRPGGSGSSATPTWTWPATRPTRPTGAIGQITTPMLVIHGELDHRVPVGEALRLWVDLMRHGVEAKFLYFPDENHWILKPQHARVWYETVLAWLDHHLLGKEWERPRTVRPMSCERRSRPAAARAGRPPGRHRPARPAGRSSAWPASLSSPAWSSACPGSWSSSCRQPGARLGAAPPGHHRRLRRDRRRARRIAG